VTIAAVKMNASRIVPLSPRKNASNESATPAASQRQAIIAAAMAMIEAWASIRNPRAVSEEEGAVAAWGILRAFRSLPPSDRQSIRDEQDLNLTQRLVIRGVP
jgi:hypothetical protein